MRKINIGIMGCANIAKRSFIPAIQELQDYFKLCAVSSRTEDKAKSLGNFFNCIPITGYENLLNETDIDAVYIPLPTGLHEEWVIKSLLAGKHVIVEKSLAMDDVSASKMVDVARDNNLVLMEDFMFKYHSQHQYVFDLLKENVIGDMRLFRSNFGFPPLDKNNFRYDVSLGGGVILDAAAYTLKASTWFLGDDLNIEAADVFFDGPIDIFGSASLSNARGNVAQVGFGFDNFYQCNYEIWGSKGKITAQRAFTPKPEDKPSMIIEVNNHIEQKVLPADNHFKNILKEFYNSILEEKFETHYNEILTQSRLLTQLRDVAKKIQV